VVARVLAESIRSTTRRVVIVENRPGAYGQIAVDVLRQAPPDGTTVLVAPLAIPVLIPLAARGADYDVLNDFAPVTQIAEFSIALAVRADHPARTVAEYMAWLRADPAHAAFGSHGAGGLPHLFGVMIGRAAGVDLVHIPYRGAAQLATDLLGGQVHAGTGALSDFLALHRQGRLRIIAVSGEQRSQLAPHIPTFREQGYPRVQGKGWTSLVAPAGTPQRVIDWWWAAVVQALEVPAVRERLLDLGVEPTGTTPEALAAIIAADLARWRPIVKATGFSLDLPPSPAARNADGAGRNP
jgi:tripartite-type tricarboxylate transporter receptor subunit TctC